jgi:hypothetical protein
VGVGVEVGAGVPKIDGTGRFGPGAVHPPISKVIAMKYDTAQSRFFRGIMRRIIPAFQTIVNRKEVIAGKTLVACVTIGSGENQPYDTQV